MVRLIGFLLQLRIVQEYFDQTDEESEKGLPLTMKGFNRITCNVGMTRFTAYTWRKIICLQVPTTQCTFVDMFARETFTMWTEFAETPQLLAQLEANYEEWKKLGSSWDPSQNAKRVSSSVHT
jgi:high affinity cAMP-specific and IBMX-insensitive 3',5'-cyclic phosphodiesterase 8